MDQKMLDDLGVALMFVNLAILAKHGLNKAADKLINSKNMSALDSNWTAWKQQAKTNLNKTADNITDVASDTLNRAKNRLPGSKLAMDGSPHVSFSKPTKPLPQNSQQQNFWKETEAGKGDLARKLDGGAGKFTPYSDEMRKYIPEPEPGDGYQALLEKYYIEIRKVGLDDVSTVAKNTGLTEEQIIKMKKHVFLTIHDKISIAGKPYGNFYFQADPDIAYAWQQAQIRELTNMEKDWFQNLAHHELKEQEIMKYGYVDEHGIRFDPLPLRDKSTWNGNTFLEDPEKNAHDAANVLGARQYSTPFPTGKDKRFEDYMKYSEAKIDY
ncbi:hypothetical protein [Paenibacillus tundrae]